MAADTKTSMTTQIHEIYIKAAPQAIWDAITDAGVDREVRLSGPVEYDLRPGGAFRALRRRRRWSRWACPKWSIDGEVIESDPPNKLVQTYRFLFSEAMKAEGFTRLTWEIVADPSASRG